MISQSRNLQLVFVIHHVNEAYNRICAIFIDVMYLDATFSNGVQTSLVKKWHIGNRKSNNLFLMDNFFASRSFFLLPESISNFVQIITSSTTHGFNHFLARCVFSHTTTPPQHRHIPAYHHTTENNTTILLHTTERLTATDALTAKLLERALNNTLATMMIHNNCHVYAGFCYI